MDGCDGKCFAVPMVRVPKDDVQMDHYTMLNSYQRLCLDVIHSPLQLKERIEYWNYIFEINLLQ